MRRDRGVVRVNRKEPENCAAWYALAISIINGVPADAAMVAMDMNPNNKNKKRKGVH